MVPAIGLALHPALAYLDQVAPLLEHDVDILEVAPETTWYHDRSGELRANGYHARFLALGERHGIVSGHQEAVVAVGDDVATAGGVGGHRQEAGGHADAEAERQADPQARAWHVPLLPQPAAPPIGGAARTCEAHGVARRLALVFLAACGGAPPSPRTTPTLPAPREVVRPMAPAAPPAPAALSPEVQPTAYRLDVAVDPSASDYHGTVDVDVTIARATDTVWLTAGPDLRVTSATITSAAGAAGATVRRDPDHPELVAVVAPAPVVGAATLQLAFAAAFRDRDGLFVQDAGGARVAYTDFEPTEARHAFPCFDDPRWRAPVTVTLRTPDGLGAFANSPELSATREGDVVVHRFAPTPPLPTYLVAFAVGDFAVADVPGAPVPARVIAPVALAHVEHARALVGPLIAASQAWIDRPFPYPKLDLIVVPDMNGAMENPGLITIAADIAVGPSDADARALVALVIAHELAHAWFGGMVTPADWRDLWLNEGLATWMSDRVLRALPTPTRVDAEHVADRLAIAASDPPDGRALRPRALRHPREVFDQLTYQKGAAVMHMLTAWRGDQAVRAALGAYLDRRPWGVATSDDLIAALAAIDPDQPIAEVTRAAIELAKDWRSDRYLRRLEALLLVGEPGTAIRFGAVNLVRQLGNEPTQHITVAVQGAGPSQNIFANGFE